MRRILSVLVLLAALAAAPAAHAWIWPAAGPVLRPFSLSPDRYAGGQHRGVDISAELGSPVLASAAGTVSFVGSIPGGGRAVTIQTLDGYAVTLVQLGSTSVLRGSVVVEGAVVGVVGESADAVTTAPHVHLGVRVSADPDGYVDPLGLLPAFVPQPVSAPPPLAPDPQPASDPALAATPADVPVAPVAPDAPVAPTEPVSAPPPTLETHVESTPAVEPPVAVAAAPDAPVAASGETPAAAEIASPSREATVTAKAVASDWTPRVVESVAVTLPASAAAPAFHPRAADDTTVASPKPVATPTPTAWSSPPALRGGPTRPAGSPRAVSAPRSIGTGSVPDGALVRAAERAPEVGPRRELPLELTAAVLVALVAAVALARRRGPGTGEPARIMGGDDGSPTAEDPGRRRVAVCERTSAHRSRRGLRRPLGHLRPVSPAPGQRRADGERYRRARHAGHGGRGRGRSLAA